MLIAVLVSTVPCCDICSPALLERTRPAALEKLASAAKALPKGLPDENMRSALEQWRQSVFKRDHGGSFLDSTAILNDDEISHLSSVGRLSREVLEGILKPS